VPGIKSRATMPKSTKGIGNYFVQTEIFVDPSVGFLIVARLLMPGAANPIYQRNFISVSATCQALASLRHHLTGVG
jgi:hypothetical protein